MSDVAALFGTSAAQRYMYQLPCVEVMLSDNISDLPACLSDSRDCSLLLLGWSCV